MMESSLGNMIQWNSFLSNLWITLEWCAEILWEQGTRGSPVARGPTSRWTQVENCSCLIAYSWLLREDQKIGQEGNIKDPVHPSVLRKVLLFFRHHCQMFTQLLLRSLQWWSLPEGNVFQCFKIIFSNVLTKTSWLHTAILNSNSKYLGDGNREQGIIFLPEVAFYVFQDLLSRFIIEN